MIELCKRLIRYLQVRNAIRHADRIIVLDKGRIAETGSFQELVEKGGLFASFVKRQVA